MSTPHKLPGETLTSIHSKSRFGLARRCFVQLASWTVLFPSVDLPPLVEAVALVWSISTVLVGLLFWPDLRRTTQPFNGTHGNEQPKPRGNEQPKPRRDERRANRGPRTAHRGR